MLTTNSKATIPVINMQDFYDPTLHAKFVADLAAAFRTLGFVAVINTQIDMQALDAAYTAAAKFFALPIEKKLKVNKPELGGARGYVLSEVAKGQIYKDFKEHYHIGRNDNIWPTDVVEFAPAMQTIFRELEQSILPILEAISEAMGQERNFLAEKVADGHSLIRALFYPAHAPQNIPWAAAHTDIDLLSAIPRSTAPGLQVLHPDGTWLDVAVPEGAFIINAGDMLQNLTNGEFRSSVHRVINKNPNEARQSMVFFSHPRSEVDLSPLPYFVAKHGRQLYPKATQEQLLFERLVDLELATDAMKEKLDQSGLVERMQTLGKESPKVVQALHALRHAKAKL